MPNSIIKINHMKNIIVIAISVIVILTGCKKKETELIQTFTKDKISGVSQKGPFLNGSTLTVIDLDSNFTQTGKTFNTQIIDNSGLFEISNLYLTTPYAKLKADGFYFNEVTNDNSVAPITLYALSDLSNKTTINVNLLSTLEVSRVLYLISNGTTFNDAKQQAQQEILNMFCIHIPFIHESELLNISQDGDNNAILLAVSLILQGYRTEAELSQLLGEISTDIRTDGILNSPILGSALINDAKLLDTVQIRSNLENKYNSLGVTAVIPPFEKYIKQFIDSCTYTFTNYITFPVNGTYGVNILNTTDSILVSGTNYSCCANLPKGTKLKICHNGSLYYAVSSLDGWIYLGADINNVWKTFESNRCGLIDFHAALNMGSTVNILFYENNSPTPTRIKNLYIQ